jgi:hypothetical protein
LSNPLYDDEFGDRLASFEYAMLFPSISKERTVEFVDPICRHARYNFLMPTNLFHCNSLHEPILQKIPSSHYSRLLHCWLHLMKVTLQYNSTSSMVAPTKVTFMKRIKVKLIPNRREMKNDQLSSLFYSVDDLIRMRNREKRLTKELALNGILYGLDDDVFGLKTLQDRVQRKKRIVNALLCVLTEQEFHWESKEDLDHENIAKLYRLSSSESMRLAHLRGTMNSMQVDTFPIKSTKVTTFEAANKLPRSAKFRWSNDIADCALVPVIHDPLTPKCPRKRFQVSLNDNKVARRPSVE